ncbi:hypothetical protein QR680_008664 [Steinernema hermaphroditum]|uniref:Peptidase M13 C-terminal domain-containing protein n=1 Tax=Steinernema hermaphroditum TaxID=289476 RepID=A0AA39M8A0_9BILA|nr:hypothetical protein QR680_008664 [Steinernema hermaphroditum]
MECLSCPKDVSKQAQFTLHPAMGPTVLFLFFVGAAFGFEFHHNFSSSVHPCDDFNEFVCNFGGNRKESHFTHGLKYGLEVELKEAVASSADPVVGFIKEELTTPEHDEVMFDDGIMVGMLLARKRIFDPRLEISAKEATSSLVFEKGEKTITCVYKKCPSFVQGVVWGYLLRVKLEEVKIEELTISAQLDATHFPEDYGRPLTTSEIVEKLEDDANIQKYYRLLKAQITKEKFSSQLTEGSSEIENIFASIRDEFITGIKENTWLADSEKSNLVDELLKVKLEFEKPLALEDYHEKVEDLVENAKTLEELSNSLGALLENHSGPDVPITSTTVFVHLQDQFSVAADLPRGLKFGILATRLIHGIFRSVPHFENDAFHSGLQCYNNYYGSFGLSSEEHASNKSTFQYPDASNKALNGFLDVEGSRAALKVLLKERPFGLHRVRRSANSMSVSVLSDVEWFFIGIGFEFCDDKDESESFEAATDSFFPRDSIRATAIIRQIPEFEEIFRCGKEGAMKHAELCKIIV